MTRAARAEWRVRPARHARDGRKSNHSGFPAESPIRWGQLVKVAEHGVVDVMFQVGHLISVCEDGQSIKSLTEFRRPQTAEKSQICFLTRHVRGRKHCSVCKRASAASALQQTAIFLPEKAMPFSAGYFRFNTVTCRPSRTSSAFSCRTGSLEAVRLASTTISASGRAALAMTALDSTQMWLTRPHSSTCA